MKNIKTPYAFLNKGLGQNIYIRQSSFITWKGEKSFVTFSDASMAVLVFIRPIRPISMSMPEAGRRICGSCRTSDGKWEVLDSMHTNRSKSSFTKLAKFKSIIMENLKFCLRPWVRTSKIHNVPQHSRAPICCLRDPKIIGILLLIWVKMLLVILGLLYCGLPILFE